MARVAPLAFALLLLFGWEYQPATANPLIIAKQVLDFGLGLYEDYEKIKKIFSLEPTMEQNMTDVDRKMFDNLNSISDSIKNLQDSMSNEFSKLDTKLTTKTNELFKYFDYVQHKYNKFLSIVKNKKEWHRSTLLEFTHTTTSTGALDLPKQLHDMHKRLTEKDINFESILSILANKTNTNLMCIRNQSPQQLIHDLYKTVLEMESKGLIIQLFAYDIKEANEKDGFVQEKKHVYKVFRDRINKSYDEVKKAMTAASRELWKCDPAKHVNDVTFSKIQAFQVFLNFEADVEEYQSCDSTCGDIKKGTPICNKNFCQDQPEEKRCHGVLRDCQLFGYSSTYCPSFRSSDRRYEWAESSDPETIYGRKQTCPNKIKGIAYEKSGLFYRCDPCLCTCEDTRTQIDRYFNLKNVTSDTYNNKVVTGVRFKKENHIFYIQIQQGRLEANGSINLNTVDWKPIEIEDSSEDVNALEVSNYKVDWDQKTVYLDDVEPKSKSPSVHEVVTGLRFKKVGNDLKLEIETTEFDYASGILIGRYKWHTNDANKESRNELKLKEPDVPTLKKTDTIDSKSDQYVQFQITDLKKDLGQYTVPFIDIQEIVTNPPMPISGVGIFHKGTDESGGFLALKLMHYDFTPHMENSL